MAGTKARKEELGRLEEANSIEDLLEMASVSANLKNIGSSLSSALKRSAGNEAAMAEALNSASMEILSVAISSINRLLAATSADYKRVALDNISVEQKQVVRNGVRYWSYYMSNRAHAQDANSNVLSMDPAGIYERIKNSGIGAQVSCFTRVQFCIALHEAAHAARDNNGVDESGKAKRYAKEALATLLQAIALRNLYSDIADTEDKSKASALLDSSNLENMEFNEAVLKSYRPGGLANLVGISKAVAKEVRLDVETDMIGAEHMVLDEIKDIKTGDRAAASLASLPLDESIVAISKEFKKEIIHTVKDRDLSDIIGLMEAKFATDAYTLPERILYLYYLLHGCDARPVVGRGLMLRDNNDLVALADEVAQGFESMAHAE